VLAFFECKVCFAYVHTSSAVPDLQAKKAKEAQLVEDRIEALPAFLQVSCCKDVALRVELSLLLICSKPLQA